MEIIVVTPRISILSVTSLAKSMTRADLSPILATNPAGNSPDQFHRNMSEDILEVFLCHITTQATYIGTCGTLTRHYQ